MSGNSSGSKVASFYSGKSVLITGGAGFLGKTLIEKLLYSCTGIDKIYVLVRDKNGKKARERVAEIIAAPIFERLRSSKPEVINKIIPIAGNVVQADLGLSADVVKQLEEEVSVVFHLAATVNFNTPLKDALEINAYGTQEVIQLCRRMKMLQGIIHVSTALSNADRSDIDEVVYPLPMSLDNAMSIAKEYSNNEDVINSLIGRRPNTYTFSKAFAEELIMKKAGDLPVAIIRPSIVISSLNEPFSGWIDNWNGSTKMFVGMFTGVLKVVIGNGNYIADMIPVDLVTNLLIVAATRCKSTDGVKVYNCCTGTSNPITYNGIRDIVKEITVKHSLNDLPFPCLIYANNPILYEALTFVLQTIPAFIIDLLCTISRKKAIQMKMQKRLRMMVQVVKFFLLNKWHFSDDNVRNLQLSMSPEDRKTFSVDVTAIDWNTCALDYVLGARKYLLNR